MTVASAVPAVSPGPLALARVQRADSLRTRPSSTSLSNEYKPFASLVSPGLLPSPSISPLPSSSSLPASSSSASLTAAIPHIPLSFARHHLSLITSDVVSHRHSQRALLEQLALSYERWQQTALSHYEDVVSQVKHAANRHIHQLQQQQPHHQGDQPTIFQQGEIKAAPTTDSPRAPSPAGLPAAIEAARRPSVVQPAVSTASPALPAATVATTSASPTSLAPLADSDLTTLRAQLSALSAAYSASQLALTQAAADLGLPSPIPTPPLRAFASSLRPFLSQRTSLASRVSSIKATQASLQAEKKRLTEWKERLKASPSDADASEWERAKNALAAAGVDLKERHKEYETAIAAYKDEEAGRRREWAAIRAVGEEGSTLPSADALDRLIACWEDGEATAAALRDVEAAIAAREAATAKQPRPVEAQPPPPSTDRKSLTAPSAALQNALATAQAQLSAQQAELERLTAQLRLQQQQPHPSLSPSPSSSPAASCADCAASLARASSLSSSLALAQSQLTSLTSQLAAQSSRIAELERSALTLGGTASEREREREMALADLSRLLDETVKKSARDLAELRLATQKETEEAVATLEKQQDKERRAWTDQLHALQANLHAETAEKSELGTRIQHLQRELSSTQTALHDATSALASLRLEASAALSQRDALQAEIAALSVRANTLQGELISTQSALAVAQTRYLEEQKRRKEFQFKYEDAKGKVRVYARVRPFTSAEVALKEKTLLRCGRNDWTLELNEMQKDYLGQVTDKWREFTFDHVFQPGLGGATFNNSQLEVFRETELFAELSLQGINTCIFAYGQSGTGKTYTMAGVNPSEDNGWNAELRGLKPRMIEKVFGLVGEMEMTHSFVVSCYMVEIYLNALEDLFWKADTAVAMRHSKDTKWPDAPELKVRVDGGKKKVTIDNVRLKTFTSAEAMLKFVDDAEKYRRTRRTGLNEASSRSHLVFAMIIEASQKSTGKVTKGKLSLVDLAGSERADKTNVDGLAAKAREAMMEEGVAINESLRMLKNVFRILGTAHVPVEKGKGKELVQYRGNMLTELMQDSLGGAAKTLMFVNVGPAASNVSESLDSLSYGDLVKNITNEKATADEDQSEQIRRLKEQLAGYQERYGEM